MADKLIFPIGFDLESGIKAAEGKADNLLRQLEHRMNQHPLQVKVEMDGSKFAMFSRQFSNNIDGISNKIAQANRLWNEMRFDVKFDAGGNLSRRAQVVFDAFKQLIGASETMGQRLNQVNRQLQQSEAETTRLITVEYDKRKRQIDQQIRDKERQAAAEERVRQSQLKGVNVGYVDLQKQTEAVRNLRLQYQAILPMLNAMAQKRVNIKIGIDRQFEADINRINSEIARLRQSNLQLGAKGDTNAIQANLVAIRQLEAELQRISQQKIDLLNTNKINGDLARLRTEIASVFGELQTAERKLASDNSLNAALDAQSQKVLNLHTQIQKLDQQIAQLNAQGKMYNADGSFSTQATAVLQQRIALTKELEQAAVTGQQAQIKLEQQLREEKRRTDQEAKQAAREAEQQAKAEAAARKQAIEAANAENKARQAAYNVRRKQGLETQRILQKEAKSIADITAQLQIQQQRLNTANVGSAKFNKIAKEVKRLTAELDKANQKMRELTGQTTSGANKQASAVNKVSQEFKKQDTYVSRLIKRLAVYAGFQQISSFLTNVRQVTAEFELQRVSLGAIIRDQNKANQIFSQIKQFAIKSPVKILDLTKYTKQVAAYRVEADELFDTTKRLADISVGLGVDMSRIVLAYGQVKAASYLRAAEVRQFTEAGIPMLELVAEKLTKMNGELVTTEQAMDTISKRGVGFGIVKEIFEDMTNAGGMFYNMQEKQGNTLYGMWAKLGDAASVMYEQIGNTGWVNDTMKGMIQSLSELMREWKAWAKTIAVSGISIVAYIAWMKLAAVSSTQVGLQTAKYRMELQRLQMQYMNTSGTARLYTLSQIGATRAMQIGTTASIAFSKALKMISMVSFGAIGFALMWLTEKLFFVKSTADEVKESLDKINAETSVEQEKSVRNFEHLAKVATDTTKGYKERKDALDELQQTYSKILPQEALELEYLDKLKGNYNSLTNSIRTYIAEQQRRKGLDEISSVYGTKKLEYQMSASDIFKKAGWSEQEIGRFWAKFYEAAKNPAKGITEIVRESLVFAGRDAEKDFEGIFRRLTENSGFAGRNGSMAKYFKGRLGGNLWNVDDVVMLRDLIRSEESDIKELETTTKSAAAAASKFAEAWENASKKIANAKLTGPNGKAVDRDSFLGSQMLKNFEIKELAGILQDGFSEASLAWDSGFGNLINKIDASKPELISTLDFEAIINTIKEKLNDTSLEESQRNLLENLLTTAQQAQQKYWGLVPKDVIVQTTQNRLTQIVRAAKLCMDDYVKYQMKTGQTLEDYRKDLKGNIDNLKNEVKGYLYALKQVLAGEAVYAGQLGYGMPKAQIEAKVKNLQDAQKVLETLYGELPNFDKQESKSGGTKSDPRLQNLKEEISLTKKLYDEYHKLEKQIGATKAAEKIQQIYTNTIKTLQERAGNYGFKFELPFTDENLKANMQHFIDKMKELQKLKDKKGKPLFPNIGKEIDEAVAQLEDVDFNSLQKQLEKKLKDLADRISRTKTAKEFYDKILKSTRDVELAANMTLSVFGIDGSGLAKQTADQIRTLVEGIGKEIPKGIINLDEAINPTKLREWADELAKIEGVTEVAEKLKKIADDEEKVDQKRHDRWAKDLEKAKEYADKRIELAQYTADQIAEIEAKQKMLDPNDVNYKAQMAMYDEMIRQYRQREKTEAAKLDYEQVKEQIGMFDDLGVRIGSAFEQILVDLKAYTQSPDFAQLGLEAQKNVYQQIAKIEDRMAEGFQGVGIGTVSEYVREYSTAASEYLTAQRQLKDATLAAIDADRKYNEAKKSGNQATIDAALAEKQLADSRVVSATAAVNTAGANLHRTQSNAARASEKFNNNLQKVESSLQSLNNGALRALWDLLGDKGKRSVGEFLSGSYKMVKAIDKLTKALADSGSDMGKLSQSIVKNLATALSGIDPEDSEAIAKAATESLKQTLSSVINDKGVVELLSNTLSKNIGEIASQALSGVLSTEDAVNKVGALIDGIADAASKTGEMWGAIISLVLSLLDEFAENGIGTFLGELLDKVGEAVEGILANLLTESIPKILGSVGNVVKGVGTGLGDLLTFGIFDLTGQKRIKRANKEIKRQQELLENLEYAYERLEKVADKAFGKDYTSNIRQQKETLEAEIEARKKQLAAEKSKGKKADKNKKKEYQEAIRDLGDQLAELEGKVAEQMFGTDLTSAARDFAKAWLDAYKEFGSTADAMSEKFHEMIENMVVESLLAKVMENALRPAFKMIDEYEGDFSNPSFWQEVTKLAKEGADNANNGARVMMQFLEQAGMNIRELGGDLTGISKEVASASSEEINANTAALNVQNYYASHLPLISQNVMAIRTLVEQGNAIMISRPAVDMTALWNQHLELQQGIYRHTAQTVDECRAIASHCSNIADTLSRVVIPNGATTARASIKVRM